MVKKYQVIEKVNGVKNDVEIEKDILGEIMI